MGLEEYLNFDRACDSALEGFCKISKNHTLGDELIDKHGPEAAHDMPEHYMHTLTRCMGQDIDFEVDLGEYSLSPGDVILLCSDGVTNMIESPEIEEMMKSMEPQPLVQALVDLANQNGGTYKTSPRESVKLIEFSKRWLRC